ncbi:MAG: hypothetical protein ACYTFW_07470 [Planctomycetota bacterium]|jgi:hypothetical protein
MNKSPYTYLLDTGTVSATALSERDLARKSGWKMVPEDDVSHNFRGDTVILNDKIMVVLCCSGFGAEIYSRTADGLKQRALLVACISEADRTAELSSVQTIENNPAVVMLKAVYRTKRGKNISVTYRLTTGKIYLGISPGPGMNKLLIRSDARHVVVPDFFGDDLVFSIGTLKASGLGLPAENFFLQMIEGNDAIVMCVWESYNQNAEVILSEEGRKRMITSCQIQCVKDKRLWIAFMEGIDIWHERAISNKDTGKDTTLDWKPPFPAKWRANFLGKDELAESLNFNDELKDNSLHGRFANRPHLNPGSVIVYPINRSRATPLMVFCPIDILRNTLGVGPCQYVLEKEGFGTELQPTPDQVTRWIENLFRKKKEKQASAQIEERLKEMIEHIRQVQTRINQYGDFAQQIRELSEKEKSNKAIADILGKLLSIVEDMEQNIVIRSKAMKPSESAVPLADKMISLIGKGDAFAHCQELGAQIRAIGAAQDKALSKCRMAVRRIKQQCIMIAGREPNTAGFAAKIQELAEQMLHKYRK